MDYERNEKVTKKIIISGIVQGVGFRPLVYHIAKKYDLQGTVRNSGGVVEIVATAPSKQIESFLQELKGYDRGNHEIKNIRTMSLALREDQEFTIADSRESEEISIIPPDLPICQSCRQELLSETDRRFKNPFISCMVCGPRYTIMEELPYDRQNTSMIDFTMCSSCSEEYTSPENRRFHAQTISCDECGPVLLFSEPGKGKTDAGKIDEENFRKINKESLEKAVSFLAAGKIIAVKGIGGYHFVCSPFLEETVQALRELKGREEKAFAVMFPSMEQIKEYCYVSPEEEKLLISRERPIVLLYKKEKEMAYSTEMSSIYRGAFLPYTPLQILLLEACGPLIMTSANISNQPVVRKDEEIFRISSSLLGGILYNERRILRSLDDSLTAVIDEEPQILRRSRGFVPYPFFLKGKREKQIFAAGSDLKAAFCLYSEGKAVVSQHFGDLEEQAVYQEYQNSYEDLSRLLKISPELVVCDMHPNYHSSKFGDSLGKEVLYVQHHHAHAASVIAEHNLQDRVIGVVFDGTGYGTDGNIWGGEFLICDGAEFERAAHLQYTPVIGGDSSMKDAKKTASCFLIHSGLENFIEDERKDVLEAALKHKVNTILTSSMGRLFDSVSSILGIANQNSYEGKCAINLEKEAVYGKRSGKTPPILSFGMKERGNVTVVDPAPMLESLVWMKQKVHTPGLALAFHYGVAEMILKVCMRIREKQGINKTALCGGVFQNRLLTQQTIHILRENGFEVFINRLVPPNDGSISLGQTLIGLKR